MKSRQTTAILFIVIACAFFLPCSSAQAEETPEAEATPTIDFAGILDEQTGNINNLSRRIGNLENDAKQTTTPDIQPVKSSLSIVRVIQYVLIALIVLLFGAGFYAYKSVPRVQDQIINLNLVNKSIEQKIQKISDKTTAVEKELAVFKSKFNRLDRKETEVKRTTQEMRREMELFREEVIATFRKEMVQIVDAKLQKWAEENYKKAEERDIQETSKRIIPEVIRIEGEAEKKKGEKARPDTKQDEEHILPGAEPKKEPSAAERSQRRKLTELIERITRIEKFSQRKDPYLYFKLAQAYQEMNDMKNAEANYKKAIEIKPNFAEAMVNYAYLLRIDNRLSDAEIFYKEALEIRPDNVRAHFYYALLLQFTGNLSEAKNHYERALKIKSDDVDIQNNYANLLDDMGLHEDAERHYQLAINMNPKYAEAHYNYAIFLEAQNRLKEAEKHNLEALRTKPNSPNIHYNYSNLLVQLKRNEEAEYHLRESLKYKPDDADAHNNYAILLSNMDRMEEAEEHYVKAINMKPSLPEFHENYARFLEQKGDNANAIEHYQVAGCYFIIHGRYEIAPFASIVNLSQNDDLKSHFLPNFAFYAGLKLISGDAKNLSKYAEFIRKQEDRTPLVNMLLATLEGRYGDQATGDGLDIRAANLLARKIRDVLAKSGANP